MIRYGFILGVSWVVAWVTGPMFFAWCGASNNPSACLAIRGIVFVAVFLLLKALSGKD